MRSLFAATLLSTTLASCTKAEDPSAAAPVQNGSFLIYDFHETVGSTSIQYDVRLDFAQSGGRWEVKFAATEAGAGRNAAPIKVSRALIPEDNVISAFDFGRLWLPPEGRGVGKGTPCGAVGEKRKYRNWDVWPVDGLCALRQGSRFYEANTGMLVGFIFSGGNEITSYLKSSGG